jgi:hypothetical protein
VIAGTPPAIIVVTGVPEGAIRRLLSKKEVIQQMRSHNIAELVVSDMLDMEVISG